MVVSDLNIICVGQKTAVPLTYDDIGIDILEDHNGYGHHWMKLKQCSGIWYQVYPLEEITTRQYDDEFFDCKFCVDFNFVIAYKKHLADIEAIIKTYIALSPIEEVLLLIRLDEDGESETENAVCFAEFTDRLRAGKILFNTIYRIRK